MGHEMREVDRVLRVLVQASHALVAPTVSPGWWSGLRARRRATPASVTGWAPWVDTTAATSRSETDMAVSTSVAREPAAHPAPVVVAPPAPLVTPAPAARRAGPLTAGLSTSMRPIVRLAGSGRAVVAIPIESSPTVALPWAAPEPVDGVLMRTIRVPADWPRLPVRPARSVAIPVAAGERIAAPVAVRAAVAAAPARIPVSAPMAARPMAPVGASPVVPGPTPVAASAIATSPVIAPLIASRVTASPVGVSPVVVPTPAPVAGPSVAGPSITASPITASPITASPVDAPPVAVAAPVVAAPPVTRPVDHAPSASRRGRLRRLVTVAVGVVASVVAMEAAARLGRR